MDTHRHGVPEGSLKLEIVTIKGGEPADHEVIASVWLESARHMDGGGQTQDSIPRLKERIATGMARGWHVEVASADANDIVGFVAIVRKDRVLDQLFVRPDHQGKGIGSALFARAREMMPDGFLLRTPVTNLAAHRFYERHGMHFLRDAPHPYTGAQVRYFAWNLGNIS